MVNILRPLQLVLFCWLYVKIRIDLPLRKSVWWVRLPNQLWSNSIMSFYLIERFFWRILKKSSQFKMKQIPNIIRFLQKKSKKLSNSFWKKNDDEIDHQTKICIYRTFYFLVRVLSIYIPSTVEYNNILV